MPPSKDTPTPAQETPARATSPSGPTGDMSFDTKKVTQYASPIEPYKAKPASIAKPSKDENATFGSSNPTGQVNYGPGSSGNKSKASGADRDPGATWDRQAS